MIAILSFLLLLGYGTAEKVTMRWAKDAGLAPKYHEEDDGSVTVEYPIFSGTYEEMEPVRRRLQEMTQQELRVALLDKHNELRSTTALGKAPCKCGQQCGAGPHGAGYHPAATNMNKLNWDNALERTAQAYADKCLFIHNDARTPQAYTHRGYSQWKFTSEFYAGENLYISSTGSRVWKSEWNGDDYGIGGGLHGWWIECEDYKYPEGGSCGGQVGHYTQYVWATTRFVGCGVTICPSGVATKTSHYSWANLNVVCNYFGGQYSGAPYEAALTTSAIASNCDPDRIPNKETGLCEGPQAWDYFENPQGKSAYTGARTKGNGYICNDGTGPSNGPYTLDVAQAKDGRHVNQCGTGSTVTDAPTPYPTNTAAPTKRPSNYPTTTRQPTERPTTDAPTGSPNTQPTDGPTPGPINIVTPRPTTVPPSGEPTVYRPPSTDKPTGIPTTTASPTDAPVVPDGGCDIQDCLYFTKVEWISEAFKYQGMAGFAWQRQKELTDLQNKNGWSSYYSWGGKYQKNSAGNWEVWIYDDIDVDFTEMECTLRDLLIAYMRDDAPGADGSYFKDQMKELILSDMRGRHGINNPGYVSGITVTVTCATSDAAAFGAIDEDGNIELPFSTWNLNTYDFSDWFVLLFVLFTGCACCFGCGWAMHRRRVFKAMDDASISDFGAQPEAPMVTMDGNASPQHITTSNDDYNQTTYATNEPEIEIGVSVNSNNHGIMAEDSE